MNNLIRWLLGRPLVSQVNEAQDWWNGYHSTIDNKEVRAILNRERDFTAFEDDWQYENDPTWRFYLRQLGITWEFRTRKVRHAVSRYFTKRYSDLLRDSLPQSTEVKH